MKEYITNAKREKIKYSIIAISLIITFIVNYYFFPEIEILYLTLKSKNESLYYLLSIIGWLAGPLTLPLIYSLIYIYIDNLLWVHLCKMDFFDTKIPNLNGSWEGKLISSKKDKETKKNIERIVKVTIIQTFSKISIKSEFFDAEGQTSTSYSSLCCLNNFISYYDLEFIFLNRSEEINTTSKEYSGYNKFTINKELDFMKGTYFTGRDSQQNHGKIELKRIVK